MIRATIKVGNSKKNKDLNLAEGDLVVCYLRETDVKRVVQRFGGAKLIPHWSEPCKISKFLNEEKTMMEIDSIWHNGVKRKVRKDEVLPLPKNLSDEMLDLAKLTLISDLRKHGEVRKRLTSGVRELFPDLTAEEAKEIKDGRRRLKSISRGLARRLLRRRRRVKTTLPE
eukprot:GHVU01235970.1.p1 GENE.GHVU01235970.1~~GHVU01235970.1.p1  ORF type:complete len:170 (-),score=29.00 GHVU01235970.1:293-802(-)